LNSQKYKDNTIGLIGSLGALLEPYTKLFIYPSCEESGLQVKNIESMNLSPDLGPLLIFLIENNYIENILDYNKDVIHIWSRKVLKMIQDGTSGWEKLVPESVAKTVKNKCLFGAKCDL
jgi:hypothetical protein